MGIIAGSGKAALGQPGEARVKAATVFYDFAVDGGAAGTISLRGDSIPNAAVVIDSLLRVTTALAGGTGTDNLALKVEAAGDLAAASARNAAPWSTTGAKRMTLDADTAPILTTAARTVDFTISTSALTAGKFVAVVWYVEF